MSRSTTWLPDADIVAAVPKIRDRVARRISTLATDRSYFDKFVDAPLRRMFALTLNAISASEGTLWVLNEEAGELVPRHNTGPEAETLILKYRQPLDRGIISTVLVTQRGVSEKLVYQNLAHDPTVNELLGNCTVHMIALPWFIGGDPAGVVSAVKLKQSSEMDPPPFDVASFDRMGDFAQLLGGMISARLLETVMENRS